MPETYAFTITLRPQYYKLKPNTQLKKAIFYFNSLFMDNDTWIINEVYPELTKDYNIHLHGIVEYFSTTNAKAKGYSATARWKDIFRTHTFYGFTNLKLLTNYPGWLEYMTKDQLNPDLVHIKSKQFIEFYKSVSASPADRQTGDPLGEEISQQKPSPLLDCVNEIII